MSKHLKLIKSQVHNLKKAIAVHSSVVGETRMKKKKQLIGKKNEKLSVRRMAFNNKRVSTCHFKKFHVTALLDTQVKKLTKANEMTNNAHF